MTTLKKKSKPAEPKDIDAGHPAYGATVKVNARLFAAVAMFRVTIAIRHYLNGVYVEAAPQGGALICASDGYQLALAYDPDGVAPKDGQIMPVAPKLLTAARQRGAVVVAIVGERLRVYNAKHEEAYIQPGKTLIDGKFPPWFHIVPSGKDLVAQVAGAWNASLLAKISEASIFLASTRIRGVTHWQAPAAKDDVFKATPMLTRFDAEPNFIVVTMPMRCDCKESLPQFLRSVIDKKKADKKPAEKAPAAATEKDPQGVTA